MGKRGIGEGAISRRKNGGWMAQYYVHMAEGRKRQTIYGETRKEVAKKLARALSDREGGLIFDAEGLKLREYLSRCLEDSVKDTVRNTTYERYEQIARTHIILMLGDVKLKGLSQTHVRGLYKEKLRTLSPRTVQCIHVTLHKALKQARQRRSYPAQRHGGRQATTGAPGGDPAPHPRGSQDATRRR